MAVSVAFKKTASLATAIGFLAAAVFLVGVLWAPANAASASSEVDVQPSLLLALDKPQSPATKLRLASLTEDLKDMPADLPSPELATELNSWAFTANNSGVGLGLFLYTGVLQFKTNVILHDVYVFATIFKAFLQFEAGLFQQLGLQVPAFLTVDINALSQVQNALSPYH